MHMAGRAGQYGNLSGGIGSENMMNAESGSTAFMDRNQF